MKRLAKILIGVFGGVLLTSMTDQVVRAALYEVRVTRTDSNLYRIDGTKLYIRTKYCYQYGYGVEAVLKYERYAYNNLLTFTNEKVSCDVADLLRGD